MLNDYSNRWELNDFRRDYPWVHCRRRPKSLRPLDLLLSQHSSSTFGLSLKMKALPKKFLHFVIVGVSLMSLLFWFGVTVMVAAWNFVWEKRGLLRFGHEEREGWRENFFYVLPFGSVRKWEKFVLFNFFIFFLFYEFELFS